MVRAILDNRKTVTRRIVKPQPICHGPNITYGPHTDDFFLSKEKNWLRCRVCGHDPEYSREGSNVAHHWIPPYRPGDILYVRETWTVWDGNYEYKADVDDGYGPFCSTCTLDICAGGCNNTLKWRPSIHMPKEAARIFLRVTDVRVERLQDITEEQARAEGVEPLVMTADVDKPDSEKRWQEVLPALPRFPEVWNSTIKPKDRALYGWEANPWVWAIEFERCEKPEEA